MSESLHSIISFILLLSYFWMFVLFYHTIVLAFGDRKHVNKLIDDLAKNPEEFKEKKILATEGMGASGLLLVFSAIYPFIRHRRRNRSWRFDLFMLLNWLYLVTMALVVLFS